MREAMPHQESGLIYLGENYKNRVGGALFMEQRLGKTLTVIRHLKKYKELTERSVLIVCPKSVMATWAYELTQENEINFVILDGARQKREKLLEKNYKFVIVNYESAEILKMHLYHWSSIVLDESIYIANPKSGRTKYFITHFLHIEYKFILCGNPAPEDVMQYFSQIQFIFNNFMGYGNYWAFRVENFNNVQYRWMPKRGVKKEIYKYLRKNCFILTRADAKLGNKKLYQNLPVPLLEEQRAAYNNMLRDFEADGVFTKFAPVKYLYLHKIAGGVKLDGKGWHSTKKFEMIIDLLCEELQNQQVVIWFRYRHEIEKMAEYLNNTDIKFLKITGAVNRYGRELLRKDFWRKKYRVAIMTIKSMRTGTDWSCADTAIYFSNEFSFDLRSQSEDRIVHPKNSEPKLIIDLCTHKTIDYDIVDLLKGKKMDSNFFMSALYERILNRGEI